MRAEDILDAIGEIDDDIIKSAKEKRKPNRAIIYALSGVAACFILMFCFRLSLFLSKVSFAFFDDTMSSNNNCFFLCIPKCEQTICYFVV